MWKCSSAMNILQSLGIPFFKLVIFSGPGLCVHPPRSNPGIDPGRYGPEYSNWWRFFLLSPRHSKVLGLNKNTLRRHFDKWGPSARTCVHSERYSVMESQPMARRQKPQGLSFELSTGTTMLTWNASQRVKRAAEVATKHLDRILGESPPASQILAYLTMSAETFRACTLLILQATCSKRFFHRWSLGRRVMADKLLCFHWCARVKIRSPSSTSWTIF